jgi:hypothetical protein
MSLYTFYFQYKGGSYTSQFKGAKLETALHKWVEKELPTVYAISKKHLKCVTEEVVNKYEEPTPVAPDKLKNVWYMGFLSGHTHMHLLIVKTEK